MPDLTVQKYVRELEVITQECILTAIREGIPTESIIRAYLDESMEDEEEVIIEPIPEEETKEEEKKGGDTKDDEEKKEPQPLPEEELPPTLSVENVDEERAITRLTFNDTDEASDGSAIDAPKTIERLEEISEERHAARKAEEDEDEDEDEDDDDEPTGSVKIHMDEDIRLDDVFDLDKPAGESDVLVLDGVEDL